MASNPDNAGALMRFARMIERAFFNVRESTTPGAQTVEIDARDLWRLVDMPAHTKSGQAITPQLALAATVVLACARVIAEGVAQVPLVLLRADKTGKTWTDREDHWLHDLMQRPNPWQTGYEFIETIVFHAVLTGNGFAFINRIGDKVKELIPIEPGRVTIEQRADLSVIYKVRTGDGKIEVLDSRDMLHLRGPSWDSIAGLEPVRVAREAIGLALATEETHARLHRHGVRLSGVLTTPHALSDEARARIASAWNDTYAGSNSAGKVAVLEGGLEFRQLAQTGVDAQHLETRRFQIEEVCRVMRVFPQMVMHADKTATFASAEQFFLAHITHTLGPWVRRLGDKLDAALMPKRGGQRLWLRFDLRGLAPGDARTRKDYWTGLVNAGIATPNEARLAEGLNPIDGGDELRTPVNLVAQSDAQSDEAGGTPAKSTNTDET